jgi:hypothetical protein
MIANTGDAVAVERNVAVIANHEVNHLKRQTPGFDAVSQYVSN